MIRKNKAKLVDFVNERNFTKRASFVNKHCQIEIKVDCCDNAKNKLTKNDYENILILDSVSYLVSSFRNRAKM